MNDFDTCSVCARPRIECAATPACLATRLVDFEHTHARSSDPDTSHKAARSVALRADGQKAKLLKAFGSVNNPMNAEEAWMLTDINSRACWWHRVSDLAKDGFISVVKVNGVNYERKASSGEWCQAYVITENGKAKLAELARD